MTTIIEHRLRALDSIPLQRGAHDSNKQMCAMEAAAWIAGEPHSDRPKCVSPVIAAFMRTWNDALDDTQRQALKPYLPRVIGTAGDGHDVERSWMAADWLVHVCIPAWLDLAGLNDSAKALRSLPPVAESTANKWQPAVRGAREKAVAACAAAAKDTGAARDAVWVAAARAAARDAVGVAAWEAVWDAVGVAVWDAAWDAVGVAVWDAAWDVIWDALWGAAGVAAWGAARDAATEAKEQGGDYNAQYHAAYQAAKVKLDSEPFKQRFEPVKVEMHRSAHELLDRMIDGPFGRENA